MSLKSWIHLCKIRAEEILCLLLIFPFLLGLSIFLCVFSLSLFLLPLPLLQKVSSPFEIKAVMRAFWDTVQLYRNCSNSVFDFDPFWDYFKTDFSFIRRPAHAVKHSAVRGQRRLRLCPQTSGAVGPKLSNISAVLSDGEGCGKNESSRLFPHCESQGGQTPSSTLF